MAKLRSTTLKIDKEFKGLLPPLDASEYATLEAVCLRDGILDPIFSWEGLIVDGHNRYEIARKHRLPYRTRELDLPDREAVKRWILEFQLARRPDLRPYEWCRDNNGRGGILGEEVAWYRYQPRLL